MYTSVAVLAPTKYPFESFSSEALKEASVYNHVTKYTVNQDLKGEQETKTRFRFQKYVNLNKQKTEPHLIPSRFPWF